LAQIKADKILMVRPIGANLEEAEALQSQIAELQSSLAAMTTRANLAEKEIARLNSELAVEQAAVAQWEATGNKLAEKIATLEADLDAATAPAKSNKKFSEHKKA
jgi:chromosome segregation ATPase